MPTLSCSSRSPRQVPGWARFASGDSRVTRIRLAGLSPGNLTELASQLDQCHGITLCLGEYLRPGPPAGRDRLRVQQAAGTSPPEPDPPRERSAATAEAGFPCWLALITSHSYRTRPQANISRTTASAFRCQGRLSCSSSSDDGPAYPRGFIAGVALIPTTVIQVGHIRLG